MVEKRSTQTFWSKAYALLAENDIKKVLDLTVDDLLVRIHGFLAQGSAWHIESVSNQYLDIASYIPLGGSS